MIAWRSLFAEIRVAWKDKGANCSNHHVNICCPWCGDDQGYHLSISENQTAYYCRRNPDHAGRSTLYLLNACGINKREAAALLTRHSNGVEPELIPLPPANPSHWLRFKPAHGSDHVVQYLNKRKFFDAHGAIRDHDLRYASFGSWAQRLLLPLTDGRRTVSWTGRAIRDSITPRYLTNECEEMPALFAGKINERTILCEGPHDALKFNVTLNRLTSTMSAAALCGKALTPGRLLRLAQMAPEAIWLCLDNDAPLSTKIKMLDALKAACRCPVYRLDLPSNVKDPGEMGEGAMREWLAKTPGVV